MQKPDDNEPQNEPLASLDSLQSRIDAIKSETSTEKQGETAPSTSRDIGDAMRVGIELVSGVAVGAVSGFFLDRWLNTMPLFFIAGLLLGAAAGFRNLIREAERNSEKE